MKQVYFIILSLLVFIAMNLRGQMVEVKGTGANNEVSSELTFDDIESIDMIVVEAIYKSWDPVDGPVEFVSDFETISVNAIYVESIHTTDGTDLDQHPHYFRTIMEPAESITLNSLNNATGIWSFVAYIYRNNMTEYYGMVDYDHAFCYKNLPEDPVTYIIPIGTSTNERDVNIDVIFSEISNDTRNAEVTIIYGENTETTTISTPNIGTTPSLAIITFALENVAADIEEIEVICSSPLGWGAGDSFISGGVVVNIEQTLQTTFCTLTQWHYGSNCYEFCDDITMSSLIYDLLSDDLILGGGTNTLTLTQDDASCLIGKLPGWGKSKKLNGEATCSDPVGIKVKWGRFKNTLLNEAITLGLNLRLNPNLGNIVLENKIIKTYKASECGNPNSDPVAGTLKSYYINKKVLNHLDEDNTISDLYSLANQALAGNKPNGLKYWQIAWAMKSINKAFKECRVLDSFGGYGGCAPVSPIIETEEDIAVNDIYKSSNISDNEASDLSKFSINIYPNPVSTNANIKFTVPFEGKTTIGLYNTHGNLIDVLYSKTTKIDKLYECTFNTSSYQNGIYILRIINGNQILNEKISLIK